VILAVAACAAAALLPVRTALTVRSQPAGELLLAAAVAPGEEFVVSYVHSVNRRPVHDTLRVAPPDLVIVKSRFDAFGAGIPETSTADNPLQVTADGWLEYTVARTVPEVTLFVGRVAEHTLHLQSRTVRLDTIARPGSAVRFRVEKLSTLRLWRTG
jgi:hypothetical protein